MTSDSLVERSLVIRLGGGVMLWRAKTELCKDAGSARIGRDTGATEDAAGRLFAAARARADFEASH